MASIPSARRRKRKKPSSGINGLILLLIVKFCGVLKQEKPGLKIGDLSQKTVFSWAKYYIPPYGFLTPDKVTEPSSTPTHMTLRRGRVEEKEENVQKKAFLKRVVRLWEDIFLCVKAKLWRKKSVLASRIIIISTPMAASSAHFVAVRRLSVSLSFLLMKPHLMKELGSCQCNIEDGASHDSFNQSSFWVPILVIIFTEKHRLQEPTCAEAAPYHCRGGRKMNYGIGCREIALRFPQIPLTIFCLAILHIYVRRMQVRKYFPGVH